MSREAASIGRCKEHFFALKGQAIRLFKCMALPCLHVNDAGSAQDLSVGLPVNVQQTQLGIRHACVFAIKLTDNARRTGKGWGYE